MTKINKTILSVGKAIEQLVHSYIVSMGYDMIKVTMNTFSQILSKETYTYCDTQQSHP